MRNDLFRKGILLGILRSIMSFARMSSGRRLVDDNSTNKEEGTTASRQQEIIALEGRSTPTHSKRQQAFIDSSPIIRKSFSERHSSVKIERLGLTTDLESQSCQHQEYRVFVGTWNVGGRSPNRHLELEDFLQIEGSSDIYILGFQEIVPLNAGNVLVIEDNQPAAKWLALIGQALNKPRRQQQDYDYGGLAVFDSSSSTSNHHQESTNINVNYDINRKATTKSQTAAAAAASSFFQRSSLKVLSKTYRTTDGALLKSCNCPLQPLAEGSRRSKPCDDENMDLFKQASEYHRSGLAHLFPSSSNWRDMNYVLISSKQMVGIFLSVWVKSELVQYVAHLRTCSVGRGIMNCLGNKGCVAISMSLHQTSFCFICSHLTSGEKEGDELKRNSDVTEILRSAQFPRICKSRIHNIPEKILEHDRIIWLGDLNYRVSVSYEEARILLEDGEWDALLEKDQLHREREVGRVFRGWQEGRIYFAPTYKYSQNSDSYAGENTKSKRKRRTPAWCDRILWYGEGIEQLAYNRGESKFSDHRPVFSIFAIQVEVPNLQVGRFKKGFSSIGARMDRDEYIPQRRSFCEY